MTDEAVVREVEPGAFLFGSWKNVFVGVWESQATVFAIDRLAAALEAMPLGRAGVRSDIHIIAEGARLPEARVREYFIEMIRTSSDHLACVSVIIGGSGFWTSALRSFVTGLHWLSPRSYDFRLLSTVDELIQWLPAEHQRRSGVEIDPKRLKSVLEEWSRPRKSTKR